MSNYCFEKISQTHGAFKQIITPLERNFGISFGYMISFNTGHYYTIIDSIDCLIEFVTQVDKSHIFSNPKYPTFYRDGYYFNMWPEKPCCEAMMVYHKNNIWNGITLSKPYDSYTELWWFTGNKERQDLQFLLYRHQEMLIEFVEYFNSYKNALFVPNFSNKDLFEFTQGFNAEINLQQWKQESNKIDNFIYFLRKNNSILTKSNMLKQILSPRELEVLSIISKGFCYKSVARELCISHRTVEHHIERIKNKLSLCSKEQLIAFHRDNS